MKNKNILIFSAVCLLSACQASVQNYEHFLNSWIGQSEANLVATWGAPVDMQTIGPNRQLFTYITEKQVLADGQTPVELGQDSAYSQNNDALGTVLDYYCKTTFTTQNDIIVNYSWNGDGCLMK